jgi:hypothetical protein
MRRTRFCVKTIIWFPFKGFSCLFLLCATSVQKPGELEWPVDKSVPGNHLRFLLCTGFEKAIAPKVCVDIYEWSVKVASVDG